MKKKAILSAMLLLIVTVGGCGWFGGNGGDGGDGNGAQTIELVMGHPFSGEHPVSREILVPLAEDLREQSDGRIQLTIHPAGAITSSGSVYEDVISGAFDIGWTLQGYTPGRYPLTEVVELPFLFETAEQGSQVLWRLFEQNEALQNEYREVKVMGFWVTDPGEIMSQERVESPDDLQGKRIRFAGPMQEQMLDYLGAVPVGMAAPEMYDGLERGIIDGVTIGYSTIQSYRLHEVINNITSGLRLFVSPQAVFMNLETWDSLSAEDQELISSLTEERMALQGGQVYDAGEERGRQLAVEGEVEIYEVSAEEQEQWRAQTTPMVEEWISSLEGRGLPAQELYDQMLQIVEDIRN